MVYENQSVSRMPREGRNGKEEKKKKEITMILIMMITIAFLGLESQQ